MDKQTIHLVTLIVAIIGSNAWSHANLSQRISELENRLSDRLAALETRVDGIDKRLVIVETSLDGIDKRLVIVETRLDGIDKRLVIVETSLKANNQYLASVLGQSKPGTLTKQSPAP